MDLANRSMRVINSTSPRRMKSRMARSSSRPAVDAPLRRQGREASQPAALSAAICTSRPCSKVLTRARGRRLEPRGFACADGRAYVVPHAASVRETAALEGGKAGSARKWRRNGLKRLNPRSELVWRRKVRIPIYSAPRPSSRTPPDTRRPRLERALFGDGKGGAAKPQGRWQAPPPTAWPPMKRSIESPDISRHLTSTRARGKSSPAGS
jgi:hypothetical protein